MAYSLTGRPFPISFSISEAKIIDTIPQKDKDFSSLIPGDLSTYIYDNEEDYYKEYQRSFYAFTWKKGGWDCLRHYEILANGCIPYFPDIDQCPSHTMHLFPKELIKKAMNLPGVSYGKIDHKKFDENAYYEVLQELLDYTKKYLTTRSIAQYMLDAMGYSGKGKILFLSANMEDTYPDYLKMCVLIGLKEIAGDKIIDFPKLDYLYTSYTPDIKPLYGKGFTYTKILPDLPVHRGNIEKRIKQKEFELIIHTHTHKGCMFLETIKHSYPPEKVAYLDGDDEHFSCPYAHLPNYFLREYQAYTRR